MISSFGSWWKATLLFLRIGGSQVFQRRRYYLWSAMEVLWKGYFGKSAFFRKLNFNFAAQSLNFSPHYRNELALAEQEFICGHLRDYFSMLCGCFGDQSCLYGEIVNLVISSILYKIRNNLCIQL